MKDTENTLSKYLGNEFQMKLLWQLLVEPEFAEKTISNIIPGYFDDPNLKTLYYIIDKYYKEYNKVPNINNNSIELAINKFKSSNPLEEEILFNIVKKIKLWNEYIINNNLYDGDVIQIETNNFIKQQEYRKIGEFIISKTKSGEIKNKKIIGDIEDKFLKVSKIGENFDDCEEIFDNIENALKKEFRETIPTGISVLDTVTGGGLGKSEFGLILSPSGVGKTTLLTKIANTAYESGKNVIQIIFEDTKDQIKRKHYTIFSGIAQSEIEKNIDSIKEIISKKILDSNNTGKLIIKRFSQEDTTMLDIRNWIITYQKKHGFKFDIIVLDYLDCVESHKKSADKNESELTVVKSFEALAADFNIPAWSAIQSNRSGFNAEYVDANQSGGSIKRIQKSHFFMSISKTPEQKEANLANIKIIKARFAKDGQIFNDCIFNNDTMEIIIRDDRYPDSKYVKKINDTDISNFENKLNKTNNEINLDDLKKKIVNSKKELNLIENENIEITNDISKLSIDDILDVNDNNIKLEDIENKYNVDIISEDDTLLNLKKLRI